MQFNTFNNIEISQLGFGAMRLPVIDGDYGHIDQVQTQDMVDYALEHGVNYFDTAYGYHNGRSEAALAAALAKHERCTYLLADKFPGYDLRNMDKVESIFEEQLKRCRVEYFDFYLIHNVCEMNIDAYLDPKYGIKQYLVEQKNAGRIKHFGFSAHGSVEVIERFLDVYGDVMEFCQLQINWIDWEFQNSREKVELAEDHGLPVWVMEPLRGGKLIDLSHSDAQVLSAMRPEESNPGWAFRFIQSIPQAVVTLSGMSNMEQLQQNIEIFSQNEPLNTQEWDALLLLARDMVSRSGVPCTECRYCTKDCPLGLDIPHLLSLYNEHVFTERGFIAPMAIGSLPEDKRPQACIGCRACEKVCPQQIKISEVLRDFSSKL